MILGIDISHKKCHALNWKMVRYFIRMEVAQQGRNTGMETSLTSNPTPMEQPKTLQVKDETIKKLKVKFLNIWKMELNELLSLVWDSAYDQGWREELKEQMRLLRIEIKYAKKPSHQVGLRNFLDKMEITINS